MIETTESKHRAATIHVLSHPGTDSGMEVVEQAAVLI